MSNNLVMYKSNEMNVSAMKVSAQKVFEIEHFESSKI